MASSASSASFRSRKFALGPQSLHLGYEAEAEEIAGVSRGLGPTHLRMGATGRETACRSTPGSATPAVTKAGHAAAGWGALGPWRGEDQGEEAETPAASALELGAGRRRGGHHPVGVAASQLLLADTLRLGRFEEASGCCHRGLSGRPGDPIRSLLEFEAELISRATPRPIGSLRRGVVKTDLADVIAAQEDGLKK